MRAISAAAPAVTLAGLTVEYFLLLRRGLRVFGYAGQWARLFFTAKDPLFVHRDIPCYTGLWIVAKQVETVETPPANNTAKPPGYASNNKNQPSARRVTDEAAAKKALTLAQPSAVSPSSNGSQSLSVTFPPAMLLLPAPHKRSRLFAIPTGSFHTACRTHCPPAGTQKEPSPLCRTQKEPSPLCYLSLVCWMRRAASRAAMVSRLSYSFLPRASAISIFARPRSFR